MKHKKSPKIGVPKKVSKEKNKEFWDKEYKNAEHLDLSNEPSNELKTFLEALYKEYRGSIFDEHSRFLDLGCGNGRNSFLLANFFKMTGVAYDISGHAVKQARRRLAGKRVLCKERSIAGSYSDIETGSMNLVIDMMTSHFLHKAERDMMLSEIDRVLSSDGYFLIKTFLRDGDLHTPRLLRENPADEEGAYIHPKFGLYEYVWREEDLIEWLSQYFVIKYINRSHQHKRNGEAFKRRFIVIACEKKRIRH